MLNFFLSHVALLLWDLFWQNVFNWLFFISLECQFLVEGFFVNSLDIPLSNFLTLLTFLGV